MRDTSDPTRLQRSVQMISAPCEISEQQLKDKLRANTMIRKDCVYFCFMRSQNNSRSKLHSINNQNYSLERVFKLKFSGGAIKVEYHGPVDFKTTSFVQSFLRDYEAFIAGKFAHKCTVRFLLNLKRLGRNISHIFPEAKGETRGPPNGPGRSKGSGPFSISQLSDSNDAKSEASQDTLMMISSISKLNVEKCDTSELKRAELSELELRKRGSFKKKGPTKTFLTGTNFTENCRILVEKIGEADADFSVRQMDSQQIELRIYFTFLQKYIQYRDYFNQDSEWTRLPAFQDMKVWFRHDPIDVVRKATFSISVDPKLVDSALDDISLIPKWHRMIGTCVPNRQKKSSSCSRYHPTANLLRSSSKRRAT